ncbi:hypothetical protein EDC01DRAFT_779653 [Geopyxis carbonaria]|nr:hypothetical protein EDC01DRAFT_779653 [Geopyxis carbonaria]
MAYILLPGPFFAAPLPDPAPQHIFLAPEQHQQPHLRLDPPQNQHLIFAWTLPLPLLPAGPQRRVAWIHGYELTQALWALCGTVAGARGQVVALVVAVGVARWVPLQVLVVLVVFLLAGAVEERYEVSLWVGRGLGVRGYRRERVG